MTRKAIVDRDTILNMLREGRTTQNVAEKFGVSRQAIDLHRRDFINQGLLPNQRAVRTQRIGRESVLPRHKPVPPKEPAPPQSNIISLDEQIDLIINAFNALKRVPELEAELETYKRKYENSIQEIERLQEREKKREEQERRWLSIQHRSDVNNTSDTSG